MLVHLSELLKDADRKKYAVGAFNALNLEIIRGIIAAAEAEKAPVILEHAEVHFQYTPLEIIGPVMVREAERAKVPVAVHLDHGTRFSAVIQALRLGLTSVMYDGSILPLDENIRNTCEIVRIAHEYGASVEAELGHVVTPDLEGEGDESFYTRPEEAKQFVAKTGVDALAVAFGTVHGMYRREPKLDFNRLQAIKDSVGIPLVMHGGSGLTDEDYQKAIARGVNKINYYSYMSQDVAEHLKERLNSTQGHLFYHDMMLWAMEIVSEHIAKKIRLFGASGRA